MTKSKKKGVGLKFKKQNEIAGKFSKGTALPVIAGDQDIDVHPLQVGHHIEVVFRDKTHRLARIISKSEKKSANDKKVWHYYVHYCEFNRRMDEWIDESKIVTLPSIANVMFAESHLVHGMLVPSKSATGHVDDASDASSDDEESQSDYENQYVMDLEHDEHAGKCTQES